MTDLDDRTHTGSDKIRKQTTFKVYCIGCGNKAKSGLCIYALTEDIGIYIAALIQDTGQRGKGAKPDLGNLINKTDSPPDHCRDQWRDDIVQFFIGIIPKSY